MRAAFLHYLPVSLSDVCVELYYLTAFCEVLHMHTTHKHTSVMWVWVRVRVWVWVCMCMCRTIVTVQLVLYDNIKVLVGLQPTGASH